MSDYDPLKTVEKLPNSPMLAGCPQYKYPIRRAFDFHIRLNGSWSHSVYGNTNGVKNIALLL